MMRKLTIEATDCYFGPLQCTTSNSSSASTVLQAVCTRWGKDPMACGSYSSVGVGSLGGEDYDIMAESVGDRLFFAGEHTTRKYPATMHGAFFTGLREVGLVPCVEVAQQAAAEQAVALVCMCDNSADCAQPCWWSAASSGMW